jgi:hypothetical protein
MTKNAGVVGSVLLSVLLSPAANAMSLDEQRSFYSIESSKIEEVTPPSQAKANMDGAASTLAALGGSANPVVDVINIGKELWPIVEKNKPVANVQEADVASAVPSTNWQLLAGWSAPQKRTFHVPYKNALGMTLVDFTFDVIYTYGGSYNGAGHYISGVTIVPSELNVQWGFTFNADVKVVNVTNAGSVADPLAAMQIQMHWGVVNVISHAENTENFYIRGDGEFSQI